MEFQIRNRVKKEDEYIFLAGKQKRKRVGHNVPFIWYCRTIICMCRYRVGFKFIRNKPNNLTCTLCNPANDMMPDTRLVQNE